MQTTKSSGILKDSHLYDPWRRIDEPLDPDDKLDEDGEEEEKGLVRGGQVDSAV